ncbi:predicted protein [Naegleria gruberi]|uniref:Predicted protein n=1 Tax=Naegleria gruberi TaxID=5762 RepID=D2VZZ8_NAEGR|nr:uncharacterized protein NAEGRDRAFT_53621 [Naegleria gruberi]EFC37618.1 predicted protein [Naegleria gruberi]|eukprot:XP_002670362.1 predicted protein [Naegleria gruberi strain NEG-M]
MSGMPQPRSPSAGPPPPSSGSSRHHHSSSSRGSSSSSHHRSGGSSSGSHHRSGSSSRDSHRDSHRSSSSSRNSSNPSSSHPHDDKRKRPSSSKSSSSKHRSSGSSSKHDSRSQRSKPSSSNTVKAPPLFKTVEHPLKELVKSSFLCNMKFQTGLPEILLDPVLLEYPKDFTENFIGYKTTSLEKNHKFELLTENNLGINMNLINPFVYYKDESAKLDPEDELLLKPVKSAKKEIARELVENLSSRPSWLKAPTYVDMINYKKAVKGYGEDLIQDVEEEHVQKIKPKTVPRKVEEKSRFEKAKQLDAKFQSDTLTRTLPNGQKVKAIACYSLLPNFATMGTKFMAANFGSDNHTLLGKRGRFGELTAKDASDSLILIQPTDDIILAEKAADDRNVQVAQYYVPVSNNDEEELFNSEKTVGNIVELVREYGGTIYEKNSSNVQVNKENEKRFKLPNHLMSKDKMTQAEIEPCVALRFDDNTSQCVYSYIQEGVNFKVLPKKKKRRVFTKVKLNGKNPDEEVQFESLTDIIASTEELGATKQGPSYEDEEMQEETTQQQSEEEEEIISPSDRGSAKKRAVQSDDEDENMEESAPNGGEENMPSSPTIGDQRAPLSEDEYDEEE